PGIAQQQDEPELTGPRASELVLERRELSPPPDQLRAQTPRSSGRQHHRTDRVWSARRSKSSPRSWPAPDLSTAGSATMRRGPERALQRRVTSNLTDAE